MTDGGSVETGWAVRLADQLPRPAMILTRRGVAGGLHIQYANARARRFPWALDASGSGLPEAVRRLAEETLSSRDGRVQIPVELGHGGLFRLETVALAGAVLLSLFDVTAQYARRQLVSLWSDVIDDLDDIVVICDADTPGECLDMRIVATSEPARARLARGSGRPVLGDVVAGIIGPDQLAGLEAVRAGVESMAWQIEQGERVWRVVARSVRGYVAVVARDLSTNGRIMQALTTQVRQLAADQEDEVIFGEVLERLVAGPLDRQRRYASAALTACEDDARAIARSSWEQVMATNHRVVGHLRQLVAFVARSHEGGARSVIRLDEVVDRVLADLRPMTTALDARIDWGGLPMIWGREASVSLLMRQLISNALEASRPGVPPVIRLTASRIDTDWRMQIVDNGVGIPPSERERVFEPLYRVPGRPHRPSALGLGLTICRRIVRAHGGRIGVDGIDGAGCVVWIELPGM